MQQLAVQRVGRLDQHRLVREQLARGGERTADTGARLPADVADGQVPRGAVADGRRHDRAGVRRLKRDRRLEQAGAAERLEVVEGNRLIGDRHEVP